MNGQEERVGTSARRSSVPPARRRIIVVDDSPLALATTQACLASCGYDVRTAASLDEFERRICEWPPDIILTDVRMPEVSGAALCTWLKARADTSHVLVVLFSGLSDEELATLAVQCGADGYFSKRRGLDRLAELFESLCAEVLW